MAAIQAGQRGASVSLLERGHRVGVKLSISGKGRCNLTNDCDVKQLIANIPGNGRFLHSAFSVFNAQDCIAFFEQNGLALKVERGGRVFPVSDSAADVVATLSRVAEEAGVRILRNKRVRRLIVAGEDDTSRVLGVATDREEISADAVIIATGGLSYPKTGSDGDGYTLAKQVGHSITELRGALVPLEICEEWSHRLMGLSLKNVRLTLKCGEKKMGEEFGEMLFTHFGVSGPIVLTLSRLLPTPPLEGYRFELNLKPALSFEQIDQRLQREFRQKINKQFKNSLSDLLPQKLIPVFIELCGIASDKQVNTISRPERQRIAKLLTALTLNIANPRPIEEAIITAGGVKVQEVNPKTMQSKLCRGLYFAGEVLDIDGLTGGYNLQAAFATGFTAGTNAASSQLRQGCN